MSPNNTAFKNLSPSDERIQYLKRVKQHKALVSFMRFFVFAAFLALWEIASDLKWIDSFFFSSPKRVALCFYQMLMDKSLITHIGITLYETIISFFLVILISLATATALWFSKTLSLVIEPYLVILNSLPKSALAPLFIVWLGTGTTTIIVAGISVAIFGCIISLYTGFLNVDKSKLTLIKTLGGSKWNAFTKVVFPSCIPLFLSNMKVNIGLSLVGVIIGEFLAARRGLGYLIIYGSQVFKLDMVITSIIILCVIAFLLYQSIQLLEHFFLKGFLKKTE